MLLENTAIHDHENSMFSGLLCRTLIDYIFLHPDYWQFQPNRLIHHFADEFRPAEDIYDVDPFRYVKQGSIGGLAERLFDIGVDRKNAITLTLHVCRDAMARTQRAVREPHHGDGFGLLEQLGNWIGLLYCAHPSIGVDGVASLSDPVAW